jgi:transposase
MKRHASLADTTVVVLVMGAYQHCTMRAYFTVTPQWSSVIHLQRRCTPSDVRDLC